MSSYIYFAIVYYVPQVQYILLYYYCCFEGTQAEMSQPGSWMELITNSKALWERVVQYGQFQPINSQET